MECDFDPGAEGLDAQVRSILLSTDRFDDAARGREYERELEESGTRLARGEAIEFEAAEVARIEAFVREGKGWSQRDSLKMIAKLCLWLGTPIAVLLILILLLNSC